MSTDAAPPKSVQDQIGDHFNSMESWIQDVVETLNIDEKKAAAFMSQMERIIDDSHKRLVSSSGGDPDEAQLKREFSRMRGVMFNTVEMSLPEDLQDRFKRQIRSITGGTWDAITMLLKKGQKR